MKLLATAALIASLAALTPAFAQQVDAAAAPAVPAPAERGTVDGFGGELMISADPDWQAKWNAPSASTPELARAGEVRQGGELHILIYLVNPMPGLGGSTNVRCDIRVTRPDGTFSVSKRDLSCYQGPVTGDPAQVRLAAPTMTFRAEPTDPRGTWRVEVVLRDQVRGVEVPLASSFEVRD